MRKLDEKASKNGRDMDKFALNVDRCNICFFSLAITVHHTNMYSVKLMLRTRNL